MATETQVEVVMPQMGVSVSEGTITKWLKQEGEPIARDEALLEISTDKVDTEVPSPGEGVVAKILVQEGETVEVGTVLAVIAPEGAEVLRRACAGSRGAARAGHPGRGRRVRGGRDRDGGADATDASRPTPAPAARRPDRPTATAAPSSPRSSRGSRPSTASTRARCRAPAPAAA